MADDPPPLRAVATWDGRGVTYRCDVCGCGCTATHVPGSLECQESAVEREWSRSQ